MTGIGTGTGTGTGRAALTAGYLEAVAASGATARDLLGVIPDAGLLATGGRPRYLSRPLFLGEAEVRRLNDDLRHVRAALVSLPGRLYGGDLAAFAAAAGLTGDQAAAVLRTRAAKVTELARADMYAGPSGLRLLELNFGSPVDGIDNGDLCRAMLRHPVLREFARSHRLSYVDTFGQHLDLIFDESGFKRDSSPVVALTDWPAHYRRLGPFLHKIARRWRARGLDAHACHLGQLSYSGGRVRLRGRPVDIVFRLFLPEHLLEPDGHALMDPVLEAAARGEVVLFTPLDAELYGSKMCLAMLSDPVNRQVFSPDQRAAIDRLLPWTRMVRPGPVTLEDGLPVDLEEYAADQRDSLILKPALLHGGLGALAGWHPDTTPALWRDRLAAAMGGPYVLQRRVIPEPELCPGDDGELVPWIVTWGVFTFPAGYGGVFARAFTADSQLAILLTGSDMRLGCCLTGSPGAGHGVIAMATGA
ncbi:MAG TPA: hypothetical protein VGS62_05865 [Streptosporangiaceae bacterium]|nr:hypothetical protein [Streptosporangiaceae bacterium]